MPAGGPVASGGDGGIEGRVKVVLATPQGDEAVLSLIGPGEFLGEMALLDGLPRSATVEALEPTETLVLHRDDCRAFLFSHPTSAARMLAVLAARIRRLDAQLEQAFFLDLPGRLATKLLELAEKGQPTADGIRIDVPLTQSELAEMVGASRQRVNRVLSLWHKKRLILLERHGMTVLRPDILRRQVIY